VQRVDLWPALTLLLMANPQREIEQRAKAVAPGAPLPEKVHSFIDHLSEWFRKHPL
jgi:hypothetical protein